MSGAGWDYLGADLVRRLLGLTSYWIFFVLVLVWLESDGPAVLVTVQRANRALPLSPGPPRAPDNLAFPESPHITGFGPSPPSLEPPLAFTAPELREETLLDVSTRGMSREGGS